MNIGAVGVTTFGGLVVTAQFRGMEWPLTIAAAILVATLVLVENSSRQRPQRKTI